MPAPTLSEFLSKARPVNQGVSDDALTQHWAQAYGSELTVSDGPNLTAFMDKAREANPGVPDDKLSLYWARTYGAKASTPGVWSDIKNTAKMGFQSLALDVREIAKRTLGDTFVNAVDKADQWLNGKPSEQLLKDNIAHAQASLTPEMRGALEKTWWDEEAGKPGDAWTDPRSYLGGVMQSLPGTVVTMAPGIGIARGMYAAQIAKNVAPQVAAARAATTAQIAGSVLEGLQQAGQTGRETRDQILALTSEQLADSEAMRSLTSQGLSFEDARAKLAEDASAKAMTIAGVVTGAFGGAGDRVLAKAFTKGLTGNLAARIAKGTVAEGALEELPQSYLSKVAENIGMQDAQPATPLTKGALNEGLGGLATGGIMGGAMTGVIPGSGKDAAGNFESAPAAPSNISPGSPQDIGTTIDAVVAAPTVEAAIAAADALTQTEAKPEPLTRLPDLGGGTYERALGGISLDADLTRQEKQKQRELDALAVESKLPAAEFDAEVAANVQAGSGIEEFQAAPTAMQLALQRAGVSQNPDISSRNYENGAAQTVDAAPSLQGMTNKELGLARNLTRSDERRQEIDGEVARRAQLEPAAEPQILGRPVSKISGTQLQKFAKTGNETVRQIVASELQRRGAPQTGADSVVAQPEPATNLPQAQAAIPQGARGLNVPLGQAASAGRDANSTALEGSPKNSVGNTDSSGDGGQGNVLLGQSYGALDGASQRRVLEAVTSAIKDPQIFRAVINALPVGVVNQLAGEQGSTERLRRDPAMFVNALTAHDDLAVRGAAVDAIIRSPAFPIAKVAGELTAGRPNNGASAAEAGKRNGHDVSIPIGNAADVAVTPAVPVAAQIGPTAEQPAQPAGVAKQPPIVRFREEAAKIEPTLPPVPEGHTRLWRGNRPGEEGQNPTYTNDLPGIAMPFQQVYGGALTYVDVRSGDLAKYENKAGTAPGAEFTLPPEVARTARAIAGTPGIEIDNGVKVSANITTPQQQEQPDEAEREKRDNAEQDEGETRGTQQSPAAGSSTAQGSGAQDDDEGQDGRDRKQNPDVDASQREPVTLPSASPLAGAPGEPSQGTAPAVAKIGGKPVDKIPLKQLRKFAKTGGPAVSERAQVELDRRAADAEAGTFDPNDPDIRMSRGGANSGMPAGELRTMVDAITATWANAPPVDVIGTMDEAPAPVRDLDALQRQGGAEGSPDAFWHQGRVYLVANEISTQRAAITALFHESLGHYGLRGNYGPVLDQVLQQVVIGRAADVRAKVEQYGMDWNKPADRLKAAEEVLAELAQTRPELGLVQRAIAAVRAFLRKIGVTLELSDNDLIANFILPARRFVEQGRRVTGAQGAPAPAFEREAPLWRSPMRDFIAQKGPGSSPAPQWSVMLDSWVKQGKFKADELEWSGVKDWLAMQSQGGGALRDLVESGTMLSKSEKARIAQNPGIFSSKITKDQVLDYLAQNGVQVTETVLGEESDTSARDRATVELDARGYDVLTAPSLDGDDVVYDGLRNRATGEDLRLDDPGYEELPREILDIANIAWEADNNERMGGTRYGSYTLPGGENYRELLLTLPARPDEHRFEVIDKDRNILGRFDTRTEADGWAASRNRQIRGIRASVREKDLPNRSDFRSSHWDQPNIVAHVRFNERTDAEGKRVLFIEEMQSDWAQKGRREGFVDRDASDRLAFTQESRGVVPRAPFVQKTDAWVSLALKRMIAWAADNDSAGSEAWTKLMSAKPQSIREQVKHHFGHELAAVTPLEIVDAPMLRARENDQIRRAVVKAIPVDVVNVLADNGLSPEQLVREPDMVGDRLPTVSRATVARGLADALGFVGARVRAELRRVLSDQVAGRDRELDATVFARDLDADVVMRLLTSASSNQALSGTLAVRQATASLGAKASEAGLNDAGEGRELAPAELARALNRHDAILKGEPRNVVEKYVPPLPFEKIAFVTGTQSAERYDLSKQVASIGYKPMGMGLFDVYARTPDGREPVTENDVDLERIEALFGKDIAAKIAASEGKRQRNGFTMLSGLDLKVGGEGMKSFYDKIVPKVANDVLKKLGGGKLDTVQIEVPVTETHAGEMWDTVEQPGFDITPEMRAAAGRGMPMFHRANGATGDDEGQGGPMFQRVIAQPATTPGNKASWDAPEPTKLDDVIYTLQDKHVDTRRVIQAIAAKSKQIADAVNVYLQEELYHGRAAKHVDDFLKDELKPLLTEMAMRKVSVEDFEQFLHARHAEERNKQIAKINPNMPDGGSGMNTQDARDYLTSLDPKQRRQFEALAMRVDAINKQTRQALVAGGLESPDTIAAWEAAYKNYVPLQREGMEGNPGVGQGFSVKGAASKRATGSKRAVVEILANMAMQREKAITRAEKNRVATALVGLATANPNADFWEVDRPPTIKYVDPHSGLVVEAVDPLYKSRENIVVARIPDASGAIVEHAVIFNASDERASRMAQALKNLDMDDLGAVLGLAAKITRYFASINTQYNPIFGIVNLTRDTQGALFNLSTTAIAGKQAEVLKHTISALRGIYIDMRDSRAGKPTTSAWAQLWEEFQGVGGQTGFRDMFRTSKDRAEAIERELARVTEGKAKQFGRAVFDWLSDYNSAMENAVRLAAYRVAKDSGISLEQAASIAKNLTVNFNRKGEVGSQAGALYAFFNASVQGTARLLETLTGPAGKKIIAGGISLGVMQALMLAAAGFDEDEPPEFVRERNLIIPIGGKSYITIPMPLGLHFLPNMGRIPAEYALSGFRAPGKRVAQLAGMFAEAFNPVGNAGLSLQTIAPTIVDPLAALAENRDWTGKPIARKDFGLNVTPGHLRAKDTASAFSKTVSKALNWLSGGSNYKPGAFSPTPDQIDYLIGQATGGVGREVMKLEQTAAAAFTGEELPTHKTPLLGRFYGSADQPSARANTFYENLRSLNEHEAEIKGRRKANEDVAGYLSENPEARLVRQANQVEREVSKLRKRKHELMDKNAGRDSIKLIEQQIDRRMQHLNDAVKAARAKESA